MVESNICVITMIYVEIHVTKYRYTITLYNCVCMASVRPPYDLSPRGRSLGFCRGRLAFHGFQFLIFKILCVVNRKKKKYFYYLQKRSWHEIIAKLNKIYSEVIIFCGIYIMVKLA